MSAELSESERTRYTAIIDAILTTADLETITRKKIRQGLEKSLGGKDLSEQKDAIKKLIEERFDAVAEAEPEPEPENLKRSNGADSDAGSASPEPVKKKAKRSPSSEDADAKLAAKLQAQEDNISRGRTTRGGDKPRTTKKKKAAPKKKSAKTVGSDSEVEDGEKPKRKAGGGLAKPYNLSEPLAQLCGEPQLPRPQVVKRIWAHIKANDLQNPANKREIICDETMMAVFRTPKVDMFKMNKDIGAHLYPVGEE